MNRQEKQELRQQLLELHYGLLDPSEEQNLRQRIQDDQAIADQWQEVQAFVHEIKDATSVQPIDMAAPDFLSLLNPLGGNGANLHQQSEPDLDSSSSRVTRSIQDVADLGASNNKAETHSSIPAVNLAKNHGATGNPHSFFWATSWAMIAAMIGCLIVGRGFLLELPASPTAKIGLKVTPLSDSFTQKKCGYQVMTSLVNRTSLSGSPRPVPANISFSLLSSSQVIFSGSATSDQTGLVQFFLPDHVVIPPDAILKVVATSNQKEVEASAVSLDIPRTRTITYLTTDRPVYRPGETIYFRSLTLNRRSLQPVSGFPVEFTLKREQAASSKPEASTQTLVENRQQASSLQQLVGVTQSGVGQGAFSLPSDLEPGRYLLNAHSMDGMFPDESLSLQVRSYRSPKLGFQLELANSIYQPGETVEGTLRVESFNPNLVPVPSSVSIQWLVNRQSLGMQRFEVDSNGAAKLQVQVPVSDEINDLKLRISASVDEQSEFRLFDVPLQRPGLGVSFYPEGGDLSIGLINRVYFSVEDGEGKPARCEGWLVGPDDQQIVRVQSLDDGRGIFEFVPQSGQSYRVEIQDPTTQRVETFFLPEASAGLPVLEVQRGVLDVSDPLDLRIRSLTQQMLTVQIACRGSLVLEQEVEVIAGENPLKISLDEGLGGVLRVTLLERVKQKLVPIAERLIYRRLAESLAIELVDENSVFDAFQAGQHVRFRLRVTDESGQPSQATLGLSVVDQAALSLADSQTSSIRTNFLLLSEIQQPQDLENADFYLEKDETAERKLDLLLGTQGWRRFANWKESLQSQEFPTLLTKLLEMNGTEDSFRQGVDNQKVLVSQWLTYRQVYANATSKALMNLRWVLVGFVMVWVSAFLLYRNRRKSLLSATALMMLFCLGLLGCGASMEGMVDADTSDSITDQELQSPASEASGIDLPMPADVLPSSQNQRSRSMQGQMAPMIAMDSAVVAESAFNQDEQWTDWLAERKVAWLLSQMTKIRDDASNEDLLHPSHSNEITDEQLIELLSIRGMTAKAAVENLIQDLQFPRRQYAHQRDSPSNLPESMKDKGDYQETLYWQPLAEVDRDGMITLEFDLPDSLTSFRLKVDGHTFDGRLGSVTKILSVQSPGEGNR